MRWLLILLFFGCSPKYEVVEQLHPGTYHTISVKGDYIILYKSNKPLEDGQIIRIPNRLR